MGKMMGKWLVTCLRTPLLVDIDGATLNVVKSLVRKMLHAQLLIV